MENQNIHSLNTVDEKLVNLKIIAKIKKDDKLIFSGELLEIDDTQWLFKGLTRWYGKASRKQTIDKINHVINDVFSFIDNTLANEFSHIPDKKHTHILKEDNSEILQKFLIHLNNAVEGLENLKITYIDDESIISKLDVIIDKIQVKTDKMNKILRIKLPN